MIRSILVPLDGSPFGEHALPMALSIARRRGASVRLLHVLQPLVEIGPELAMYTALMGELRQEKQKYLDGVVQRVRETSEVPVTTEVAEGDIVSATRAAAEGRADLVVMTTHGRGPVGRFWLGSVADQLVRELTLPLLLVHPLRKEADFQEESTIKNILLPLDGGALAEQVIPTVVELAKGMDAEVTLFRVVRTDLPPDFEYRYSGAFVPAQVQEMKDQLRTIQGRQQEKAEEYLREVADRIRSQGVRASVKVSVEESPVTAILNESAVETDLVALATHGTGGLKRLWLGSVADKVIRGSTVPVLVQRPSG